jgi:hypothetical protein
MHHKFRNILSRKNIEKPLKLLYIEPASARDANNSKNKSLMHIICGEKGYLAGK